jgi:hypothetical protein
MDSKLVREKNQAIKKERIVVALNKIHSLELLMEVKLMNPSLTPLVDDRIMELECSVFDLEEVV